MRLLFIVFLYLLMREGKCNCDTMGQFQHSLDLVANYAATQSPQFPILAENDTGVTSSIRIKFWVSGLHSVDESKSDFTIIGGLELRIMTPVRWDRYSYNNESCPDLFSLGWSGAVDPNLFWRPNVYSQFLQAHGSISNIPAPIASFYYHGEYTLLPFGFPWMKFSCEFTPTYYPFDTQLCQIDFGLYGQRNILMNLTKTVCYYWSYKQISSDWVLLACSGDVGKIGYEGNTNVFFLMQRRPELHLLFIVIPTLLLALTNPVIFLMPAQAMEKSAIGLTFLLTFFVFLQSMKDTAPKTAELPYFSVFLLTILTLNCVAIAFTAVLFRMSNTKKAAKWNFYFFVAMVLLEIVLVIIITGLWISSPQPDCTTVDGEPSCVWLGQSITVD